jgi:hypothetical protein
LHSLRANLSPAKRGLVLGEIVAAVALTKTVSTHQRLNGLFDEVVLGGMRVERRLCEQLVSVGAADLSESAVGQRMASVAAERSIALGGVLNADGAARLARG